MEGYQLEGLSPERTTPRRTTPWKDYLPSPEGLHSGRTPPLAKNYGIWQAGGTHPTGMLSCSGSWELKVQQKIICKCRIMGEKDSYFARVY